MYSVLKKINVLYVDGDISLQERIIPTLEVYFDNIFIASDGFEAVSIFDTYMEKIDLVIIDIDIDTISGLDVANVIKQAKPHMKVIVLSDISNTEYFLEAIRIHVDSFILKPLEQTKLIEESFFVLDEIIKNTVLEDTKNLNTQYEQILDTIALVSKTDLDGKITYVNKLFCETSEYEEDELIGKRHNILRDPLVPKVVYQKLWKAIASGETYNGKISNISKSGVKYTTNSFISPVSNDQADIVDGYMSVSFLINEYEVEAKKIVAFINKIQKEKKQLEKNLSIMHEHVEIENKNTQQLMNEFEYIESVSAGNLSHIAKLKEFTEEIKDEHGEFLREHKKFMRQIQKQESSLDERLKFEKNKIASLGEKVTERFHYYDDLKLKARDVLKLEQIIFRQKKEIDSLTVQLEQKKGEK